MNASGIRKMLGIWDLDSRLVDLNFMNFMQPQLLCYFIVLSLQTQNCRVCSVHIFVMFAVFAPSSTKSARPVLALCLLHPRVMVGWLLVGQNWREILLALPCSFYPKLVYQIYLPTHMIIFQDLPTCDSQQIFGILTLARVLLVQPGLFLFLGGGFGDGRVFGVDGGGLHHFFFCVHFWSEGRHLTPAQVFQCLDKWQCVLTIGK